MQTLNQNVKTEVVTISRDIATDSVLDGVEEILNSLPEDQASRLKKALTSDMDVYPVAKNIYSVESHDEDGETSVYTTSYPSKKAQTCECQDFLFRGVQEIIKCKHLWRVRLEIKAGNIPPVGTDPYRWLLKKINDRIVFLLTDEMTEEEKRKTKQLQALKKRIREQEPYSIDYKNFYKKWYTIAEIKPKKQEEPKIEIEVPEE